MSYIYIIACIYDQKNVKIDISLESYIISVKETLALSMHIL